MNVIESLKITDLVIPDANPMEGYAYPGPIAFDSQFDEMVHSLNRQAESAINLDFSAEFDGILFRGRKLDTINGRHYTLRRIATSAWEFNQLGLAPVIEDLLMDDRLSSGGFVAIVGRPGQGKSTTCASVVVERMRRFGGLCLTIEDPVEVRLHGQHGDGRCLQMDVSGGREEYRQAILGSMRAYPAKTQTMVYVGEIRDGFAAANLLRSALDGRLVFTTFHAADPIGAIERLVSLASEEVGENEARNLLASSLRFVLHQELTMTGGDSAQLHLSTLINVPSVQTHIRKGMVQMASTEMERQQTLLKLGRTLKDIMS